MKWSWKVFALSLLVFASFFPMVYMYYLSNIPIPEKPMRKIPTFNYTSDEEMKPGAKLHVKTIQVIDANIFFMNLEGDHQIKAIIPYLPMENAYDEVVQVLSEVESPVVMLRGPYKGAWIVELTFLLNGKPISLDSYMKSKGLIFE